MIGRIGAFLWGKNSVSHLNSVNGIGLLEFVVKNTNKDDHSGEAYLKITVGVLNVMQLKTSKYL